MNISIPIMPRIDIEITDIPGVKNYKFYEAKLVGTGGLMLGRPFGMGLFPDQPFGMGLFPDQHSALSRGLTTPEKIDAAVGGADYTLLQVKDELGGWLEPDCQFVTMDTMSEIMSSGVSVGHQPKHIDFNIKARMEHGDLRMVQCDLQRQTVWDVDAACFLQTPFHVKNIYLEEMVRRARGCVKIDAEWERVSAGRRLVRFENLYEKYFIWNPANSEQIRAEMTEKQWNFQHWFIQTNPFDIAFS